MPGFDDATLKSAIRHLKKQDDRLAVVIERVGPPDIRHIRGRFATLVRSIISQQISGAAARTIQGRLKERVGAFTAPAIAELSVDELRELGVSNQKAGYLLDLAAKADAGELRFRRHGQMSDEEIITELTQVKGIGRWTVQMYLIFSLSRTDVFPEDDLGVRNAMIALYGVEDRDRAGLREIASAWSPYSSIASWYCWRSLDLGEED